MVPPKYDQFYAIVGKLLNLINGRVSRSVIDQYNLKINTDKRPIKLRKKQFDVILLVQKCNDD